MVSARDADAEKVISSLAAMLEKTENVKMPEWAATVKTGTDRERPPTQDNWWFLRAASILRKLSVGQAAGVSRLRKVYGGRKNMGHKPEHKRKASGSVIRKVFQQLEAEGLVEMKKGKGRIITKKGERLSATLSGLQENNFMDKGENYEVRDISLAEQGKKNIEWAESQMGALLNVRERFRNEKPLEGTRVGMALHVTKETAVLIRTLVAGGAEVAITGCNPLSTQDDVAAALATEGVKVWAYKGETKDDYYRYLNNVIEFRPNVTIDDGCDLVSEIHTKHPELISDIWGGCEETTTGIIRLKAMERDNALKYPMMAVNDNKTKHLMDNYIGTGQSTLDGIMRASSVLLAGKTLVVCGFGSCGKGVSLRAKGMGADVVVTEVDPFRALQARFEGYRVMPLEEAAKTGDMFITVTGNKHVIRKEHMNLMKDGAILANSGHFDIEIDLDGLKSMSTAVRKVRPFLDEYALPDGRKIFVAGEGRLVNLAAAEGHPSTIMSMSFCGQALAVEYIVKNRGKLDTRVIRLPDELDNQIARLQLDSMGIAINEMTGEQKDYMGSWKEGT